MPVFRYLKARWRIIAPAALVLAALVGYLAFGTGGAHAATLTVHRATVTTEVRVTGTVIAAERADLGFAESGRILATYGSVGEHVAGGTIIAELENGDKRAAVARQEAVLREARANLDAALAGTRPEEAAAAESATAAAVRASYTAASDAVINRADLIFRNPGSSPELTVPHYADLKESLERDRRTLINLLPAWQASLSSLAPEQTAQAAEAAAGNLNFIESFLDDAMTAVSEALPGQVPKATLEADAASIAAGRTNVANVATALAAASSDLAVKAAGSTSEDIAIAQARVAAASADLASARAALRKTRVIAPFAGVVTRMDAKPGEIVSPSASAIAMQSEGAYELETFIPEVAIANVEPGQEAMTTLDAYGGATAFSAVVMFVDPADTIKNGVPAYKAVLALTEGDARIRSGMTASVTIVTGTLEDSIVVPEGAIARDQGGAYVMVIADNKPARRAVQTGASPSLGTIEIVEGLSEGEVISLAP